MEKVMFNDFNGSKSQQKVMKKGDSITSISPKNYLFSFPG